MGIIFSILITISYGLVFNSVQANTISLAFEQAFGVNTLIIGLILAFLTSLIIFGGVQRIARATEIIVPIMAIAYVVVALFVILKKYRQYSYYIFSYYRKCFWYKTGCWW